MVVVQGSSDRPDVPDGRGRLVGAAAVIAVAAAVALAALGLTGVVVDGQAADELGSEPVADGADGEQVAGVDPGSDRDGGTGDRRSRGVVAGPMPAQGGEAPSATTEPSTTGSTTSVPDGTGPSDDPSGADPTLSTSAPVSPVPPSPTTVLETTTSPASGPTSTATVPPTSTTSGAPPTSPTTTAPTTSTATTLPSGAPVAGADTAVTEEDRDVRIFVLDNDDPGDAALDEDTLEIVAGPRHAERFRVHNDHLHYRSVEGYVGTDTLRYRICDAAGRCDEATVTITVTPS